MFGIGKTNAVIKTTDRRTYFGKQSSENIIKDTNGQLVCANVPIARTGKQEYYGLELSPELEQNKLYIVERLPEDVFNKEFIASFENTPFTNLHPDVDVIVGKNHSELAKGFVKDVRPGHLEVKGLDKKYYSKEGYNVLYADIVVTDPEAIEFIESELKKPFNERKIDVSCGYDAEYIQTGDYSFRQIGKNGNHVALVPQGRAGIAKIRDEAAQFKIEHNNEYFKKALPYEFDGGLKKLGISKYELKEMTADEYFNELVNGVRTHFEDEVIPSDEEKVNNIINYVYEGHLLDIPYLLYNSTDEGTNNQDGRHRVEAMKRMGVQDIPVLVLYKTHKEMKTSDGFSIVVKGHIFESTTVDNKEELEEIAMCIIAEMESTMKFKITKDADGSYDVETEDAGFTEGLIKKAIVEWKKAKVARSTSIKESQKIAGIIDLLEKSLEQDEKEQLASLKKAKEIGEKIKSEREKTKDAEMTMKEVLANKEKAFQNYSKVASKFMQNKNPQLKSEMDSAFKEWEKWYEKERELERKGVKDAKPYEIKVKDHLYIMEGFDSKAQAKEYALMLHDNVKDAISESKWDSSLYKRISEAFDFLDSTWKEWDNVKKGLSNAKKHQKTLEESIGKGKKGLYEATGYETSYLNKFLNQINQQIKYFDQAVKLENKLKGLSDFKSIKSAFNGTEWDLPSREEERYNKNESLKASGPMDMYIGITNGKVTKTQF